MYALVDCNSFYATCEKLFRPDLRHKPVVVLSNNDGCVVARSAEAKALGIKMAVPYFQVKEFCKTNNVAVFSSNYALYADMSQRVMATLEQLCPTVEIYSIDEAFLYIADYAVAMQDLDGYAQHIRDTVYKHTGITVGVGIGRTKTLAKLANYAAKKYPATEGTCVLTKQSWIDRLMQITEVGEVWGVGKRYVKRLNALGIYNTYQLAQCEPAKIRQQFGVVLERTCRELNGQACIEIEHITHKKQILSSRSFSQTIHHQNELMQAISGHVARACVKLRQQGSVCKTLTVFAKNSPFSKRQRYTPISGQYHFLTATDDTRLMLKAAKQVLDSIYKNGIAYAKAGVMLSDICQPEEVQLDLLQQTLPSTPAPQQSHALMSVLDKINNSNAADLYFASQHMLKEQPWQMRRDLLSHRYTTCIDEIPIAK